MLPAGPRYFAAGLVAERRLRWSKRCPSEASHAWEPIGAWEANPHRSQTIHREGGRGGTIDARKEGGVGPTHTLPRGRVSSVARPPQSCHGSAPVSSQQNKNYTQKTQNLNKLRL